MRRTLVVAALLTGPVSLVLFFIAPWAISVWIGNGIDPPRSVLAGLALWALLNGVSSALAMFFNGAGILRLQVAMAILMGSANVAVSIYLVQTIGVAGPIWGTTLTQIVFGFVPCWLLLRRTLGHRYDGVQFQRFLHRWSQTTVNPHISTSR